MEYKTQTPKISKKVGNEEPTAGIYPAIVSAESTDSQREMEKLSRHQSEKVRLALLGNVNITNAILCNMCTDDKSEAIRTAARRVLIKKLKR
ncbi:MAG: hypothetical protein ACP5M9_03315 [Candidatus Micrarchaeia archaeon]